MLLHTDDSAGRLAAIVTSCDDAIVSKDLNGIVTSWNAAAERLFGYTAEEAIGRSITLIIPADRQAEEEFVLGRVRAGVGVDHFETVRRRKDGSMIDISLTVSPIRAANGDIIGASKIARDITESKRLRKQLEEASRAKDEFLAVLSHELRTPLNTILGYAQILQAGNLTSEQQSKALGALGRNAEVLSRLVNELFDTSAIVTGRVRMEIVACDLSALVDEGLEGIRFAATAKGLTVDAVVAEGLIVSGDPNRLRQVLWNVLSNAVKFTSAGRVRVTAERNGTDARVVVEDTGVGLAPESIPLIFQRFWQVDGGETRQHGGLGLGLALARHFIEMHGGSITAASDGIGRGSTFEVRLPVRNA